jgi:cell volume regulation protein A
MPPLPTRIDEPGATALLLATLGLLLLLSIAFSRATARVPVPLAFVFVVVGILAGSEGIGGIVFEDYGAAFRLGTVALALILFDGGLNTTFRHVRKVLAPAGLLATVGVVLTAGAVAAAARALGFPWEYALLLGAVVSSTDAAAVFGVLKGSGIRLRARVSHTLEVESGINDPMAVILTMLLTARLTSGGDAPDGWALGPWLLLQVVVELGIGGAMGWLIGTGGRLALARLGLLPGGLLPVLSLAVALLAYGAPTLVHGSGFLSVYVAGMALANGDLPYRAGLLRVHDALAWLGQVVMFLVLGLLVFPSRLLDVGLQGAGLALFLAIVARPAVVALCLLPFRYPWRETLYVGWVGLRGAVPVVLATMPVLAGVPGAERLFDVVFFIVVVNALVPGSTVAWVTRQLKVESDEPPAPRAVLAIESATPLDGDILSFHVDEALAVAGVALADLPFPDGAGVMLIVRGRQLVAARGTTTFEPGDHVYVFVRREDRGEILLMFGRPEED